ncbi:MAG: HipA domain-containing protein [Opitutales bacterium]|nr:HipA domain-containing protein [Opitutales bacterium]
MQKRIESLEAWYHQPDGERALLGRMGISGRGRIALEVADAGLLRALSPVVMARLAGPVVYPSHDEAQAKTFQGLFGLFADSLPDTFGLDVVRTKLRERGFATGPLEILAYLGEWGRGAISYEPSFGSGGQSGAVDIAELFDATLRVQDGDSLDLSDPFAKAMGTAGGTRPKAFVVMEAHGGFRTLRAMDSGLGEGESAWMVKFDCTGHFRGQIDHETRIEAAYLHAASEAGIRVPESRGLEAGDRFHLATRRFDRTGAGHPLHMHTLWGLAQAPSGSDRASYDTFARAAARLTNDLSMAEQVLRRLAFNVLTGNMDDHPKQHAFLYDGRAWSLAPAYDLTFSERFSGHSMPVLGSVRPDRETLLAFARETDVRHPGPVLDQVIEAGRALERQYLVQYGVPQRLRQAISARIQQTVEAWAAGPSIRP